MVKVLTYNMDGEYTRYIKQVNDNAMKTVTTFGQLAQWIGISLQDLGYEGSSRDALFSCPMVDDLKEQFAGEITMILS